MCAQLMRPDNSVVVNGAPDKHDGLHPDPVEQWTDGLANSTELKVSMSHALGSAIVPNHSADAHKLEKPSSGALAMVVDRPTEEQNGLQHSITLGRPPGRSARSDAVLNCTTADIAAAVSQQGGTAPLPTATTLSGGACLQLSIGLKVILLSMLQVLSTNSNLCARLEDTAIITSSHSLFSSGRVQHYERSISMNHLSFKQSEHATVYALSLDIPSTYSCHQVYSAHPSSLISSTHAS